MKGTISFKSMNFLLSYLFDVKLVTLVLVLNILREHEQEWVMSIYMCVRVCVCIHIYNILFSVYTNLITICVPLYLGIPVSVVNESLHASHIIT